MGISVGLAGVSAWLAYDFYISHKDRPAKIAAKCSRPYQLIYNKYWVDEFYFSKIINPLIDISKGFWEYVDVCIIDNITYKLSDFVQSMSRGFKKLQNGQLQQYGFYVFIGLVVILSYVIVGS